MSRQESDRKPDLGREGPIDRPTERNRAPTIKDVAEQAGVAIGTVSRFLNKQPVRKASREAIEATVKELGYRMNLSASAMKTNRSRMVGFLVPEFDEYHSSLMQHLMLHLKRRGLVMLIYYHSEDRGSFEEAIHFFLQHRVDALVASGSLPVGTSLDELQRENIPVVVYDSPMNILSADEVLVANAQAARRAVSHLLDMGHRRVAIITGDLQHQTARERLRGYEEALIERGVDRLPEYRQGGQWTRACGYASMQTLMSLPAAPTAVFFSNYRLAIGALTYLRERGIRVPQEVSVLSFDDVSAFQLFSPAVSAIAQPVHEIAESIAALLFERLLDGQERQSRTLMLPCTLELRDSVGPVRPDTAAAPSEKGRSRRR